jgi:two-component system, NtrC family, nitrogen regulation response regulator GlnG
MTLTVVVIEDEPATRDLIVGYLTRRGNRVTGCSTLAEAAQALQDLRPDAVVSDVGLPDGDGANFCLDNVARLPHARWLVMSAQSDTLRYIRKVVKRPDAPPVSVFDKPIPLHALDDVVHRALLAMPPMRSSAADGQFDHVP